MATPVSIGGRTVWGNPFNRVQITDRNTGKPAINADGTPKMRYNFGLAIPAAEFVAKVWPVMQAEALKHFPAGVFPTDYAWKYVDGINGMDKGNPQKGIAPQPYSKREGYAGCYVLSVSSSLENPPPLFRWTAQGWQQCDPNNIDGNKFKTGDYIEVGLSIDAHMGQSPGLYINPQGVQFVGFGTAIMNGPDATAMFGAGPAAIPAGASPTPLGAPAGAPGMPGLPAAPLSAPAPMVPPAAPVAALPPANSAPSLPTPIASPTSLPPAAPAAPLAPPAPGFAAAAPAAPPPPAAPVGRQQVGVDSAGKPYYLDPATGQTTYSQF